MQKQTTNMETKHTKGLWFVGEDTPNGLIELKNHISILSDKWDIACVFTDAGDDLDEPKYNAKLIAAAPELLECCITLDAAMEIIKINCPLFYSATEHEKIKETIKKATI